MKFPGVWAVVLLLLSPSPLLAAELAGVLNRLQTTAGAVQTIQSAFVQEKHMAMFSEKLQSSGRFFFQRPGRLRWEYEKPVRMGFVIDGGRARRWNSLAKQDQHVRLENSLELRMAAEQLLVWTELNLDKLRRAYDIKLVSEQPVALQLTPRGRGARQFVDHLRVTFSPSWQTVTEVAIHEAGGDKTILRFFDTKVDGNLDSGLFQP